MAVISYTSAEQAGGRIGETGLFEKKPLGFREDDGLLSPYSVICYWSHIYSLKGGETGELSHKGFEILTFVLDGVIEHYDYKLKRWKSLVAGDAQVIRSGNGVIRSLRLEPGTSALQIWTDPNLEKSLNSPSSYDNYSSDRFQTIIGKGISTKVYCGPGSPVKMETEGVVIKEVSLAEGQHKYNDIGSSFVSGFVIEGSLTIKNNSLEVNDFFIAKGEAGLNITALSDSRLFIVESPLEPGYPTYAGKFVL